MRHLLVSLLSAVLLAGCSTTQLAYGNADWLLQRWAAGLLDPDGAQSTAWRARFGQAMQAHRRELLPEVIGLLAFVESAAVDGLDRNEVACLAEGIDTAYRRHARWAMVPAAEVLAELSPGQVAHLEAAMRERNDDYRERYLDEDPVRREQARVERYLDRIERWTGDLSDAQLREIEPMVRAIPDVAQDWLDYREGRQRALLTLLEEGADRDPLQAFLAAWWVDLAGRPAEMTARWEELQRATFDLILAVDAGLSDAQRRGFRDRVAELRHDLQAVGDSSPQKAAQVLDLHACRGAPTARGG